MKIAFNPSTVAALITPPNNKDITFDLRGRNIFARGVKFYGTDTWRDIKINNVSIGSNILDLRNGSNTTLTNTNGVVTINSTWRPVVDNLTSDSTTSSLSANQGRVLAGLINTLSTNISNQYALRDGSNATGRWRGGLACFDVRDTNYTPHDLNMGLELLFLRNNTNNLKDGGEYNGVFSFRQWASGSGWSGGKAHQLSFTDNGNIWHRTSSGDDSWGTWKKLAYSTDIPSSLKNPYSLTTFGVVYDGSTAKTVTTSTFVSQLPEGTSTVTDGTMFITSWASDSGFADTSAVNVPYKRKASCLWNYIDSKVSSKYLPLAGGTMSGNARIGHGSGNLYIGNSGNDGCVYTQDIASQKGTDKWWIRESGAAHFGNVYICTKSDYTTYDSSIIECYAGNNLYLNYYSPRGVSLCNGGGCTIVGPYTTGDTGNNKLFVNGSEFINGASNVRDHVFADGFRHRSHNSNDSVLLAGGGYSQGVPVRYWAIYYIYIGGSSTDVTYTKRSGNYNFITSKAWESEGVVLFDISFPSGYNKNNTLIFGNGDHRTSSLWRTPVYATITTSSQFGYESKIRVMISDDSTLNTGFANIYFMCMG